jgi:hypothetical protein
MFQLFGGSPKGKQMGQTSQYYGSMNEDFPEAHRRGSFKSSDPAQEAAKEMFRGTGLHL